MWWVRHYWAKRKPKYQKSFTDLKYGGKKKAYKAAQDYLKILEELHPVPDKTTPRSSKYHTKVPKSHKFTLMTGVTFNPASNSWIASWQEGPKQQRNKQFGIGPFGYRVARNLAITARLIALMTHYDEQHRLPNLKETIPSHFYVEES